jgi:hypothetical protein
MAVSSTINIVPDNTSILQPTKFTFIIPDLPFAKYFCQSATLPGVSTSPVNIETPFSAIYYHGDKLVYDAFSINAIVDEELRVWEETYNWLTSLTKPEKWSQYAKFEKSSKAPRNLYYDGILTINTNANNPNLRVKFRNCHPVSLGAIQFSTSDNAGTIPTADITFRYDSFEIERL